MLGLAFIGFALYWNVLPAPFVFDDEPAIAVNEQITHFSSAIAPQVAGSPLAGRPLVALTFAANYAVDGLNVAGFRLVNIALHIACALLIFFIAGRALAAVQPRAAPAEAGTQTVAFAIALLWLVHPLNTEAVDYVSQRTELLMAAFFLLTLYFTPTCPTRPTRPTRPSSPNRPALSVLFCALGMACKETMVVAPVIVLLYDRTFESGSFSAALRTKRGYYAALAATWLILVALLWASPRGNSAGFAGAAVAPWTYLLDQSVMIVRYLRLAVWPRGLVLDYGPPAYVSFADVAPYAIAVSALLLAAIAAVVRNTPIGFIGAWFFLTLAPTSSIVPISTEVGAERRMYLPLVAVVVLAVVGVRWCVGAAVRWCGVQGFWVRRFAGALLLATSALLGAGTVQRNAEYLSGLTLWQTVLDRWPPHARAHQNLAAELKLAGRRDEEIVHLREAAKDVPELRNALGVELLSLNRANEAAVELARYVRDYPRDSDGWSNYGNALAATGQNAEAVGAFQRAVDIDPANGLSQRNLALQLLDQNDFAGAVAHARDAVRLTPNDPDAHNLLGLALAGEQQIDAAIAEFRASLALRPDGNEAAGYLERALRATRRSP